MRKKSSLVRFLIAVLVTSGLVIHPLAAEPEGAKLLAITFDDGPGPYTAELLDGLAERGVSATFFVNGANAAAYPETLKRIVSDGHQLANHTYNHRDLNQCSAKTVQTEISSVQALITAAGGDDPAYIRAPYGNSDAAVRAQCPAPLIYWSVDPEDWKYRDADTVQKNLVSGAFDGAILLAHDIHKTTVPGALAAIDELMEAGYEFVTVKELLLRRGIEPQAGVIYYSAPNLGVNLTHEQLDPQYFDERRLEKHWAYQQMKTCLEYGWLEPDDKGQWLPDFYISRSAFVTALARRCGVLPTYPTRAAGAFSDVEPDSPSAPYIAWACGAGIVKGYSDGSFRPEETLTREQIAAMLARFYISSGQAGAGKSLAVYSDAAQIAPWATAGVSICTGMGILEGSGGAFHPQDKLTRAQTAAILLRMP